MENNLPTLVNISDISEQSGLSSLFIRKVISTKNRNIFYRNFEIKKAKSGTRKISSPLPNLKMLQNWIVNEILKSLPDVSPYAKAYRPNLSIKDNVKFHRNQKYVLKIDINNFFNNITNKQVFLLFRSIGYNTKISSSLANIVTIESVGLPQGAPTSPFISNLILISFDNWMGSLATKNHLRYTRYADDITLSGQFNLVTEKQILSMVSNKLLLFNLTINKEKVRFIKYNSRQVITGLTVNKIVNVNIKYRRKLRLELHHFLSNHSDRHLKKKFQNIFEDSHTNNSDLYSYIKLYYVRSLIGKIDYLYYINPVQNEYFKKARNKLITIENQFTK